MILKHISTLGPIGYLPAPGTCATLVTLPFAYILFTYAPQSVQLIAILLIFFGGAYAVRKALPSFGNQSDPSQIVIDEVAGTLFAFACVPLNFKMIVLGFILFRVLDIFKFGLIKKVEELPGEWGIMGDDLIAGVVTNLILQMVVPIFS